jgi:hypothetical protein
MWHAVAGCFLFDVCFMAEFCHVEPEAEGFVGQV